jgi:hypothetical protein
MRTPSTMTNDNIDVPIVIVICYLLLVIGYWSIDSNSGFVKTVPVVMKNLRSACC